MKSHKFVIAICAVALLYAAYELYARFQEAKLETFSISQDRKVIMARFNYTNFNYIVYEFDVTWGPFGETFIWRSTLPFTSAYHIETSPIDLKAHIICPFPKKAGQFCKPASSYEQAQTNVIKAKAHILVAKYILQQLQYPEDKQYPFRLLKTRKGFFISGVF